MGAFQRFLTKWEGLKYLLKHQYGNVTIDNTKNIANLEVVCSRLQHEEFRLSLQELNLVFCSFRNSVANLERH